MISRILVVLLLFLSTTTAFAQPPDKKEVLEKYDTAIALTENLTLLEQDVSEVLPKIRLASRLLLQNELEKADQLLESINQELQRLESERPDELEMHQRLDLFQIYTEVFQKFILLAFFGYLIGSLSWVRNLFLYHKESFTFKWIFMASGMLVAALVSYYDFMSSGGAVWSFFDIQVILIAIIGNLCGIGFGIVGAILSTGFRYFFDPLLWIYAIPVILAGAAGGFLARWFRDFRTVARHGFILGFVLGLIQGAIVSLPVISLLPWYQMALTVLLIAFLDGVALWLFYTIVGGLLRHEYQKTTEEELLKTKLMFLQSQIKPHFLFNAINTIASVCGLGKPERAEKLLGNLADFLRGTLKREEEMIPLEEEIRFIDSYLEIEQARFEDKLEVKKHFEIPKDLWRIKIPLLILQPLVENAVRYSVEKQKKKGIVEIKIECDKRNAIIQVRDNGVGMSQEQIKAVLAGRPSEKQGLGIGLKNIQQRLIRYYGDDYVLRIESVPGQGTNVQIMIPRGKDFS